MPLDEALKKAPNITFVLVGSACRLLKLGFALIELSVVIVIVDILTALLLPAQAKAKDTDQQIHCTNNQKQMGLMLTV